MPASRYCVASQVVDLLQNSGEGPQHASIAVLCSVASRVARETRQIILSYLISCHVSLLVLRPSYPCCEFLGLQPLLRAQARCRVVLAVTFLPVAEHLRSKR